MQCVSENIIPFFTLDLFPTNLGDISDNHCDSFHKVISAMEEQYYRKWNLTMLAGYCWQFKREAPDVYKSKLSWKIF
jgi:hypothetical protein